MLKELISRRSKSQQEIQVKESGQQRVVHKNLNKRVTNSCDRLLREQEWHDNENVQHEYKNDTSIGADQQMTSRSLTRTSLVCLAFEYAPDINYSVDILAYQNSGISLIERLSPSFEKLQIMDIRHSSRTELVRIQGKARNWTDLHLAVYFDDLSEIHKQIENGVDIEARTDNGETALHIACFRGNSECIRAILKHNPCMNVRENHYRNTPLHIFMRCSRKKSSVLKLMLDMGADPKLSQIDGDTPLHIIAVNLFGDTPLHIAMQRRFMEIIPILLRNGASLDINNCFFVTPFKFINFGQLSYAEPLFEFGKYIIMQISIKKVKNHQLLDGFCQYRFLKLFKDKCDTELAELKSIEIDGSYVTYYDLLISPLDIVAKYLRNKHILNSVMAIDHKKYTFGGELSRIIQEALRRNEATDIGYEFFKKFSPVVLPDLCLDLIFKDLTNEDFRELQNFTLF
ncbi:hypothetical protein WA026_023509 [Henosepilachna vigintioctopunctata]|uniref:Uncharacterized protein n=1 Tax=Henosepilachna vigintioctopunctata TaxID=420089 RepID=A0AAW1UFX6_9CUCU